MELVNLLIIIQALKDATSATTQSEVSSLLGLSTYSSRFIKNHTIINDPLRMLTRNKRDKNSKATLKWTEVEQKALKGLKEAATGQVLQK